MFDFSDLNSLKMIDNWMEEGLDKLYILGAFESEIEEALYQAKHDKDIINIERLGWMEYIITCKFNTNAKGLIPKIGKLLPKAKFQVFKPGDVKRAIREK